MQQRQTAHLRAAPVRGSGQQPCSTAGARRSSVSVLRLRGRTVVRDAVACYQPGWERQQHEQVVVVGYATQQREPHAVPVFCTGLYRACMGSTRLGPLHHCQSQWCRGRRIHAAAQRCARARRARRAQQRAHTHARSLRTVRHSGLGARTRRRRRDPNHQTYRLSSPPSQGTYSATVQQQAQRRRPNSRSLNVQQRATSTARVTRRGAALRGMRGVSSETCCRTCPWCSTLASSLPCLPSLTPAAPHAS